MNESTYIALAFLFLGAVGWLWSLWRWPSSPLWLPLFVWAAVALLPRPFTDPWRIASLFAFLGLFALSLQFPKPALRGALRVAAWLLPLALLIETAFGARRAGFGNPNMAGSLLLLVYPWGNLLLVAVAIGLTQSRGAALAFMVALSMFLLKREEIFIFLLVIGLTLMLVAVMIEVRMSTVARRLEEWHEAHVMWKLRPWLGWGAGAYPTLYNDPGRIHADNGFFTIMVETGIIGYWAWALVLGAVVVSARGHARWGLLAWLLHQVTDDTLWWPLVGIALVCSAAVATPRYYTLGLVRRLGCHVIGLLEGSLVSAGYRRTDRVGTGGDGGVRVV